MDTCPKTHDGTKQETRLCFLLHGQPPVARVVQENTEHLAKKNGQQESPTHARTVEKKKKDNASCKRCVCSQTHLVDFPEEHPHHASTVGIELQCRCTCDRRTNRLHQRLHSRRWRQRTKQVQNRKDTTTSRHQQPATKGAVQSGALGRQIQLQLHFMESTHRFHRCDQNRRLRTLGRRTVC